MLILGIIFGYEVSRLARNNENWYHLLDLSAVWGKSPTPLLLKLFPKAWFGALIADCDGVYDPRLYNDRAVGPDNRLVAATLERNWEEKLLQLQIEREEEAHGKGGKRKQSALLR